MTYAIVSDIHANADALKRVLGDAASSGAEKLICLGDIVGYGPLPHESLALIREAAELILAGNHDDAVSGRMSDVDFIDLAGDAIQRHRAELSKAELDFLSTLPYTATIEGARCAHGDFTDPKAFGYLDTEESAKANFAAASEQLLFVGHTHVPQIYVTGSSGAVHTLPPQDFIAEAGKRYIVNVGSVGYPREANGECYSSYVLYETETRTVRYRFLPFAVASLLQRSAVQVRKTQWLYLGIAIGSALLLCLASLLALRPTPKTETPAPSALSAKSEPPPLAEKTLALAPSQHFVHANLKLERNSPGAHLTINFEDAAGRALTPLAEVVPYWSHKAFPAPRAAVKATLEVRALVEGAPPKIKSFAPSVD